MEPSKSATQEGKERAPIHETSQITPQSHSQSLDIVDAVKLAETRLRLSTRYPESSLTAHETRQFPETPRSSLLGVINEDETDDEAWRPDDLAIADREQDMTLPIQQSSRPGPSQQPEQHPMFRLNADRSRVIETHDGFYITDNYPQIAPRFEFPLAFHEAAHTSVDVAGSGAINEARGQSLIDLPESSRRALRSTRNHSNTMPGQAADTGRFGPLMLGSGPIPQSDVLSNTSNTHKSPRGMVNFIFENLRHRHKLFDNLCNKHKSVAPFGMPLWKRTCEICSEEYAGAIVSQIFPPSSDECAHLQHYCIHCLKDWFLLACKDESKMPPKCCTIISVSVVRTVLSLEQLKLYQDKYEEWSTPNKLYCPVLTCSCFISPRLYTESRHQSFYPSKVGQSVSDGESSRQNLSLKTLVDCPACKQRICTTCKSSAHSGEPCNPDLDLELETRLTTWHVKRCPQCGTGVRRIRGCYHMTCRCSAEFCWKCLSDYDSCPGLCDLVGESTPHDPDDLDGPDCDHVWYPLYKQDLHLQPAIASADPLTCRYCQKQVSAVDQWVTSPPTAPVLESINEYNACVKPRTVGRLKRWGLSSLTRSSSSANEEKQHWNCLEDHQSCIYCPKEHLTAESRSGLRSGYMCGCLIDSNFCLQCKELLLGTAADDPFYCSCGMVACGECKKAQRFQAIML